MKWRTVANARAGKRRGATAQLRVIEAYRSVFTRDDENVEIVLADLANFCGFYKVPPIGAPPETLLCDQGLRASFGRLFQFLNLPEDRLKALEEAALRESLADNEEGIF